MGVYVVVDHILKAGDTHRNWLQMLHVTEQVTLHPALQIFTA
jgi:hypothetical protein